MTDSKHVAAYRTKYLKPGDSILVAAEGYTGKMMGSGKDTQQNGALLVTNTLVVFYRKGFFGEINQSIPLDKITSIEQSSILGFKSIKLHTSHDELGFTTAKPEYARLVEAIEAGRTRTAPKQAAAGDSPLDALKKLGELRAAGVLTEQEFESKKQSLLAKL